MFLKVTNYQHIKIVYGRYTLLDCLMKMIAFQILQSLCQK